MQLKSSTSQSKISRSLKSLRTVNNKLFENHKSQPARSLCTVNPSTDRKPCRTKFPGHHLGHFGKVISLKTWKGNQRVKCVGGTVTLKYLQ